MESQNVLVVGYGTGPLERVIPLLARSTLGVRHAVTGVEAVTHLRDAAFDLVVVRHPVAGTGLGKLVDALGEPSTASFGAALLVVADAAAEREVAPLLTRAGTRILSADARAERVLAAVAELLATAPRSAARVEVAVPVRWQGDDGAFAGETVNVSTRGLLVRAVVLPPVGSSVAFELGLPGGGRSRGVGEVVRHTDGRFALSFVELDEAGQAFLRSPLDFD